MYGSYEEKIFSIRPEIFMVGKFNLTMTRAAMLTKLQTICHGSAVKQQKLLKSFYFLKLCKDDMNQKEQKSFSGCR